jgi:hypothetical protein
MNKRKKIAQSTINSILVRQRFRCANSPGSGLDRLANFLCPLWRIESDDRGFFDDSFYDIDHIKEVSISGDNSLGNLQALCKSCHGVKTRSFMKEYAKIKLAKQEQSIEKNSNDKSSNESDDENKSGDDNKSDDENDSDVKNESDDNNESDDENKSDDNNRSDANVNIDQFKCNCCNKTFTRKESLEYHMNNKVCIGKKYVVDKEKGDFSCKYCGKTFKASSNMYRHVNHTCKVRKHEENGKELMYKQMVLLKEDNNLILKENENLKRKITSLEKKAR